MATVERRGRRSTQAPLKLPDERETSMVSEAKAVARDASGGIDPEPGLVNWSMRLLEAVQDWNNRLRRR